MRTASFTEFRQNATAFFDAVEKGETIRVLRHGRAVADIVPTQSEETVPSWRRPGLRLSVKGASLSRAILEERAETEQRKAGGRGRARK